MTNFEIRHQRPQDAALIDPLLDRTFGPERQAKTVYRLREGRDPLPELSFVALDEAGALLASLRFWPILIERTPALLFGPLAVEPDLQGQGIGRALLRHGLKAAAQAGHRICVVVGDPPYYVPFGFTSAAAHGLVLPGPVDPKRFQVLELVPGALEGVSGVIGPADETATAQRREVRGGTAA